MGVLPACVSPTVVQYPRRHEEGAVCPGTRVTDDCELCEFWDSNSRPLQEQQAVN